MYTYDKCSLSFKGHIFYLFVLSLSIRDKHHQLMTTADRSHREAKRLICANEANSPITARGTQVERK